MSRNLNIKKKSRKQEKVAVETTPAPDKAPVKAKAPAKPRAKTARKKTAKSE